LRSVGKWPDSRAPAHHPIGLTVAARRLAEAALEELGRLGVVATLDKTGRAHFRAAYSPSRVARLAIERHGDLIEAYLLDRATRWIHLNPLKHNQRLSPASASRVHPSVRHKPGKEALTRHGPGPV
jgi:hypothetical protein